MVPLCNVSFNLEGHALSPVLDVITVAHYSRDLLVCLVSFLGRHVEYQLGCLSAISTIE